MNIPPFAEVWINQKRKRFYLFKEERVCYLNNNFLINDRTQPLVPSLLFKPEDGKVTITVTHQQRDSILLAGSKRKSIQITEPTFFSFMSHDFFIDNIGENASDFFTTGVNLDFREAFLYSRSDNTIFIIGDTGTGKELLAKNIHYNSPRKHDPFIVLNCASLDQGVVERALFGNVKGAFTEGIDDSKGAFIAAGKGTLVLDDIANLPLSVQPMLLRAIEIGEIRPIGSDTNKHHNARLIITSNVSPRELLSNGLIREDLFYRIESCTVYLPELQNIKNNIISLAQFFAGSKFTLTERAKQKLLEYNWPGNIRELKNVIERARSLIEICKSDAYSEIDEKHLLIKNKGDTTYKAIKDPAQILTWDEAEPELIRKTLIRNSWNIGKTCEELKIARSTLLIKVKNYNICKH